jgi:tRNA pseudouridine38-40 synthase
MQRLALGVSYRGTAYQGWQSQASGRTVQDELERALCQFAAQPIRVHCAGRTDAGVHACNQVVHVDAPVERDTSSWVRGTNRYLPGDIAVQWCVPTAADFDARRSAVGRRYRYVLLQSAVRPAIELGACGWTFQQLDGAAMREAAACLLGEHDFSSFRAAECQALSPVKTLRGLDLGFAGRALSAQHLQLAHAAAGESAREVDDGDGREGASPAGAARAAPAQAPQAGYWRFDFDANAFLHHMVRNLVGCLVAVGSGRHPPSWMAQVLAARSRAVAAPTFAPDGLYFLGPYYDARHALPEHTPAMDWLP